MVYKRIGCSKSQFQQKQNIFYINKEVTSKTYCVDVDSYSCDLHFENGNMWGENVHVLKKTQ